MTLVAFVRGRRTRSTRHGVQAANGFLLREQEPPCEVLYSSPVQSCSRSRRQRSYLESGLQRTPQCKTSLAEATRLFRKCVNAHLQEKGNYFTHRLHGIVGKHSRRGATPPPLQCTGPGWREPRLGSGTPQSLLEFSVCFWPRRATYQNRVRAKNGTHQKHLGSRCIGDGRRSSTCPVEIGPVRTFTSSVCRGRSVGVSQSLEQADL